MIDTRVYTLTRAGYDQRVPAAGPMPREEYMNRALTEAKRQAKALVSADPSVKQWHSRNAQEARRRLKTDRLEAELEWSASPYNSPENRRNARIERRRARRSG